MALIYAKRLENNDFDEKIHRLEEFMKKITNITLLLLAVVIFAFGQIPAADISSHKAQIDQVVGVRLDAELQSLTMDGQKLEPLTQKDKNYTNHISASGGGDNVATATVIASLPYSDVGSTVGMTDDYEELCVGYTGNAPDVVYSFTPATDTLIDISLCESAGLSSPYFTHMWVYENSAASENVIACNRFNADCSIPLSAIYEVSLTAGNTYYIVIDGENGASGDYQIDVDYTPVPEPPAFFGSHPTIGDGGSGYNLVAYEDKSELMFTGDVLLWFGTNNNFLNYTDVIAWSFSGLPTYAQTDYWGDDSVFYGTLVPPATENGGASTYLMSTSNAGNADSFGLSYWDWGVYGWHDMKMADIACTDGAVFSSTPGDHRFGIISMIHSTTYTDPTIVDGPFIFYQTTSSNSATISWYDDIVGCQGTSADIDEVTRFSYAVYDPYDDVAAQRYLLIRRDVFGDPNNTVDAGGWTYALDPGEEIAYPSVSANNGQLLIVTEYTSDANPGDIDIICWYDPTGTGNADSLVTVPVVFSTENERYPELTHINGFEFICTFHMNGALYSSTTTDGGQTWSNPMMINLEGDDVVNEYRSHDVAEKGTKIMYEYVDPLVGPDTLVRLINSPFFKDDDSDGIANYLDNCPFTYNPDQLDVNTNGIGDICETCCTGDRGNVDGDEFDQVDIDDLVFMVDYQFRGGDEPSCFEEADVNGSGVIDIEDVVYLVDYMFSLPGGQPPVSCQL